MPASSTDLLAHVFARLREVRQQLGLPPLSSEAPGQLMSEVLDSMGLVELLAVLGEDHGVRAEAIEKAAGHRFDTVADLATALERAGRGRSGEPSRTSTDTPPASRTQGQPSVCGAARLAAPTRTCWLSSPCARLPQQVEDAHDLDARLGRPAGWLESHAGIRRRHVWGDEDALESAAEAGRASLGSAGLLVDEVGALLVT